MFDGKKISVVVPAYNEARQIGRVVATIPSFVDEIVVVDDGSHDGTAAAASAAVGHRDPRLFLVRHEGNRGVGAAIRTGYQSALDNGAEVVAVMAGDGQMDPADLERVISPVVRGEADYTKGDRLNGHGRPSNMPLVRYLGVELLTQLTRIAAGYPCLRDSQSGFTAISSDCLHALPLARLYAGYGYPNHMLILLGAARKRVSDVPVRSIYGEGETSDLRPWSVAPRLLGLLCRGYLYRLAHRPWERGARRTMDAPAPGTLKSIAEEQA